MKHLSSGSFQLWQTPAEIARNLRVEYDLVLDAAASAENSICPTFLDGSPGSSGLVEVWFAPGAGVYCNPPYEDVGVWLDKALVEVYEKLSCDRVVMLLPAAVGVSWFLKACLVAEVHLFDRRIRYELPPRETLAAEWQEKLYKPDGSPKVSPGGGNCLVIIERGGLIGVTGMRSAKTGRFIVDFLDGARYPE